MYLVSSIFIPTFLLIAKRKKAQENNKCLFSVFYCRILRLASDSWSHVTYLFFTIVSSSSLVFQNYRHQIVLSSQCCSMETLLEVDMAWAAFRLFSCKFICCCRYICLQYQMRTTTETHGITATTISHYTLHKHKLTRERERGKKSNKHTIHTQLPIKLRRKDAWPNEINM